MHDINQLTTATFFPSISLSVLFKEKLKRIKIITHKIFKRTRSEFQFDSALKIISEAAEWKKNARYPEQFHTIWRYGNAMRCNAMQRAQPNDLWDREQRCFKNLLRIIFICYLLCGFISFSVFCLNWHFPYKKCAIVNGALLCSLSVRFPTKMQMKNINVEKLFTVEIGIKHTHKKRNPRTKLVYSAHQIICLYVGSMRGNWTQCDCERWIENSFRHISFPFITQN